MVVQLVVHLVGSGAVEGCDRGGQINFENVSVDGTIVSRGLEYVRLWRTSDIEMTVGRTTLLLDDARMNHVLFLSVENPV